MRYLGIDPGQSGGLALLNCKGYPLALYGMPETEAELWIILSTIGTEAGIDGVRAFLELVRSSPQMSKGSIWTFAQGYGTLRAFLIAAGIPFVDVAPRTWQKEVGVMDKTGRRPIDAGDMTAKKNRHKEMAGRLFPSVNVTHKISDALLMAEYGRRASGERPLRPKS